MALETELPCARGIEPGHPQSHSARIARFPGPGGVLDVALILAYIDRGSVAVSPDVIREVLRRLVPDREEEIMGHLTQPYFAKGLAEGRSACLARTWDPSRHGSDKQSMDPISSRFSNHPETANTVGSDGASAECSERRCNAATVSTGCRESSPVIVAHFGLSPIGI